MRTWNVTVIGILILVSIIYGVWFNFLDSAAYCYLNKEQEICEVARKIRDRLPHKKIILTTTYSLDNISKIIDSIGITSEEVILKPFNFSELFSILKEPRISYN